MAPVSRVLQPRNYILEVMNYHLLQFFSSVPVLCFSLLLFVLFLYIRKK